jgi:signal transduction histidine kinase
MNINNWLVLTHHPLDKLLDKTNQAFWVCSHDLSEIFYTNSTYEKIFGRQVNDLDEDAINFLETVYTGKERVNTSFQISFLKRILPEDKPRVFAAIEKDSTQIDIEYRILHPNGSIRWMHTRTYPLKDSLENSLRVLGITEDITFRKLAEEETLIALQRASELNDAKLNFINNISHEIRTPLTVIQSSIDLLLHYKHQFSEEKSQRHFHKIETAVKRITQIIQDIVLLSEAEANVLQFQPCSINISKLCSDITSMVVSTTGTQRNIELSISENVINQSFAIDPKLLTYIITNLLDNALKYSNQNSHVKFVVNYIYNQIIFSIQDEGIGISNEDLPYIFDSFYRSNQINNISGIGLGLTIVKRCVDLHKGEINVNSTFGNGTTITVKFPLD